MNGPADTLNYMIAGYVVVFTILPIYLISLAVRFRNLHKDEETLRELEKKE